MIQADSTMRDLWHPGVSVAPTPEAPDGGNHQGFRGRPSLPTLVKHRVKDSAGSSRGREWQNTSDPKTQSNACKKATDKLQALHERQAPVVAKETATRSPITAFPEVSVGQPQESAHPSQYASQIAPAYDSISEDVVDGRTDCSSPANDRSSSCSYSSSRSVHDTTVRAGRLSVLVSEGSALHAQSTSNTPEHSAEAKGGRSTVPSVSKPQPFQRTRMRKEKASEGHSSSCVQERGPTTTEVKECSAATRTISCVGPDSSKHGHPHSSECSPVYSSSSCASGAECGAMQSSRSGLTHRSKGNTVCGDKDSVTSTLCSGERSAMLDPNLQYKPSLTFGDPDSAIQNKTVAATVSQPPTTKPAVDRLLSLTNSSGSEVVSSASSFCGWLRHEPALQRDAIFATKKEEPPPRRSSKSSIRRKVSAMSLFRHYGTVAEYMVEYLEHHSFTYATVRVYRPPPKLCCGRQPTEDYSEVHEVPESSDADHEDCSAVTVASPPKAKGKNWICLVKPTPPSINKTNSDIAINCRCTSRGSETGAGEEEELDEGDRSIDEATTAKQEKGQELGSRGPLAASRRPPPLSVVTEEVEHTSSDISISKYLIVHSQKNQVTATQPKDTAEVAEDDAAGSISQEVDPCDSSIQVCDSGPSLTESHTSLEKGKDMQNVYKFPQFQPVSNAEKHREREESRACSSKQTIISKARSLGLVSHYVLHEKKLRDLLDQCVWQERTKSCQYGRRTASREGSKRKPDKTKEARMTPSQRGLSAAVRVYTAQMGANWAATSREQSLPSREKSCLPQERSLPFRETSSLSREKSSLFRERSLPSREKSSSSRQKSCRSHPRRSSNKGDHSAATCDHHTTSSNLHSSGASRTAPTHTAPSVNVSATSVFLRRRSAASGRSRALPVVPEQSPRERSARGARRDRAKAKRLVSALPQSTLRIQRIY